MSASETHTGNADTARRALEIACSGKDLNVTGLHHRLLRAGS